MKQGSCLSLVLLVLFCSTLTFSQLARQWIARYAGDVKGGSNGATAVAVDNSENVIVTGWAQNRISGADMVTIKYSADGEQLWVKSYNLGQGTKEDKGRAIAVDTGNNIYVTGWSDGGSTGMDFVTIKYLPNGDTGWVRRYDGPGHGDDRPVSIAVNDSLNVFVTGSSAGAGTGLDFATLKYDSAGNLIWVNRYDGPRDSTDMPTAMVLRGMTDLYVAGLSVDTTSDYTLIKYNAETGAQRWVSTYKGPGEDIPAGLVLRGAPDLYLTGASQNAAGNYDILTANFDSAGALIWTSRYDGPAGSDDAGVAVSVSGSSGSARIYVTGRSIGVGSFYDLTTLRLNSSDGSVNWVDRYNGTANDDDEGVAMIGTGNPIVIGSSADAGIGLDYTMLQYSTGGNQQFALTYNSPTANSDDVPAALADGPTGTYVTGVSKKIKGSEWLTIKYADPNHLKYRSFRSDSLFAPGVSLVAASSFPTYGNVRDTAFARAYPKIKAGFAGAPGGLVIGNPRPDSAKFYGWMRFTKGAKILKYLPQTGTSRGFDLYGGKFFAGEKKDPVLTKFNDHITGELVALRIAIGASDAEVTPQTFGDLTYQLHDTVNGIPLFHMTMRDLAALTDNMLTYWKHYQGVEWTKLDTILMRVNNAFNGPLKMVSKAPLTVTGAVSIDSVVFLSPSATPLLNPLAFEPGSLDMQPEKYTLYQNYPNPFNPTTTIEFDLPEAAKVSLKVFDLLGREVATLADNEPMDAGNQEFTFAADGLASGIYFYRLVVDEGRFTQVRKMVLLK